VFGSAGVLDQQRWRRWCATAFTVALQMGGLSGGGEPGTGSDVAGLWRADVAGAPGRRGVPALALFSLSKVLKIERPDVMAGRV
jgi:hypothetical protein